MRLNRRYLWEDSETVSVDIDTLAQRVLLIAPVSPSPRRCSPSRSQITTAKGTMVVRYETHSDINKFNGQVMQFYLPENADGCMKCMVGSLTCCTYTGQGTIKVIDDDNIVMHSVIFGPCVRPSPVPCFMCCGFGPCAIVQPQARDKDDPNKWVGSGGICAGGRCTSCMHSKGDNMIIDADHDGSAPDKYAVGIGGYNSNTPPCLVGKEVGVMMQKGAGKPAFKGGAPTSNEMAR